MTIEDRIRSILDGLFWGPEFTLTREIAEPIIEAHIKRAIEEERETCALICEEYAKSYWAIATRPGGSSAHYAVTAGNKCADKIRNRKGIDQ